MKRQRERRTNLDEIVLKDEISRLKAQRDELTELITDAIRDGRLQTFPDRERFRNQARAALAKLEGTKP